MLILRTKIFISPERPFTTNSFFLRIFKKMDEDAIREDDDVYKRTVLENAVKYIHENITDDGMLGEEAFEVLLGQGRVRDDVRGRIREIAGEPRVAGLTEDEVMAIVTYTSGAGVDSVFATLNNYISGLDVGIPRHFKFLFRKVLSGVRKLPYAREDVLFRGMRSSDEFKDGEKICFPAFTSTTKDIWVARENFMAQNGTLCVIYGNYIGHDIRDVSVYPRENEILLEPCNCFVVRKVFEHNNCQIVFLEGCVPDECPFLGPDDDFEEGKVKVIDDQAAEVFADGFLHGKTERFAQFLREGRSPLVGVDWKLFCFEHHDQEYPWEYFWGRSDTVEAKLYLAWWRFDNGEHDEAKRLLREADTFVSRVALNTLQSDTNGRGGTLHSALAHAFWAVGDRANARMAALQALENGCREAQRVLERTNPPTEPEGSSGIMSFLGGFWSGLRRLLSRT